MEINSSANVSLHTIQKNSMKLTETASQNIEKPLTSSRDTVNISDEAQALFNEGGGHPTRPVKK
jgi:hypothetical protein